MRQKRGYRGSQELDKERCRVIVKNRKRQNLHRQNKSKELKSEEKSISKSSEKSRHGAGFTEEKKNKEECHFTIWNACIQIGGRSFGARRMQLYLHCHIPPAWIRGKDTLANPIVELGSFIKVKERWI